MSTFSYVPDTVLGVGPSDRCLIDALLTGRDSCGKRGMDKGGN